jgi:cardiolipin synthase
VIDGRWSSVGSSNIDPFSLLLAREANVFADDPAFALTLRTSLQNAIDTGAQRLPPAHWHAQPLLLRVRMWLAYGLTRLLLALSGTSRWQP